MAKILYVEDDAVLAESVKEALEAESHTIEIAYSAEDALQLVANYNYEIILLDWDLPGAPGLEFCTKYRGGGGGAWILFITGKSDIQSKENAYKFGGDDYMTKPFSMRELSAKMQAVLRRVNRVYQEELTLGDMRLDVGQNTLHVGDANVHLMPKESALLEFFLRNLDKGFSSKQLLASVWSSERDVAEGVVRTYVKQLRNKMEKLGKGDVVQRIAGIGYIIRSHNPHDS